MEDQKEMLKRLYQAAADYYRLVENGTIPDGRTAEGITDDLTTALVAVKMTYNDIDDGVCFDFGTSCSFPVYQFGHHNQTYYGGATSLKKKMATRP